MKRLKQRITAFILGLALMISGIWIVPAQAEAADGGGWVGAWSTSRWNSISKR